MVHDSDRLETISWSDPETGYTWTYSVTDGKAKIEAGGRGACAVSPKPTGTLTIPSSLDGKPVTSIGEGAFPCCSGLTTVTIPSGVTSIGDKAFEDCNGLTSFTVDSANPSYSSINGLLCSKDGRTLIAGVNGDVTIPSNVTNIAESAFLWCSGLTSVTIPSGVTRIGNRAFSCCYGLRSITVDPANPSYLSINGLLCSKDGRTLIAGVNGDVTIPSGVTRIGDSAFEGCGGLTSVTIPPSVTSIGACAFSGCRRLASVTIPPGVTSIEFCVFSGCRYLMSVEIPSGVTRIGDGAFWCCSNLTSVTIPSGVTSIGDDAFFGCDSLMTVTIPASVTSIGMSAFDHCSFVKVLAAKGDVDRVKGLLKESDGLDISDWMFGEISAP